MKKSRTVRYLALGLLLAEAAMMIIIMTAGDAYQRMSYAGAGCSLFLFAGAVLGPLGVVVGWLTKIPSAVRWGWVLTVVNTLPVAMILALGHAMEF